jgi:D-glycero-D-manno-heptose 1,7-bisphosphate phosphatase
MAVPDAVFLDRDGTINVKLPEGSYVYSPRQLRLLPRAGEAVRTLNEAGVLVLVVTNQRGVALGKMSLSDVLEVHAALASRLRRFGAKVDKFYICPHADDSCGCRKPAPGLFFQARSDYPGLDLKRSVMIGDRESDVEAGLAAGVRAIRLGPKGTKTMASQVSADLSSAVAGLIGPTPERSEARRKNRTAAGCSQSQSGQVSERLILAPS